MGGAALIRKIRKLIVCSTVLACWYAYAAGSAPSIPDDPAEVSAGQVRHVIVVDSAIPHYNDLLQAVGLGNARVVAIQPDDNPVEEIDRALASEKNLKSIHIVSHGEGGKLFLAGQTIDLDYLRAHRTELARWSDSFQNDGEVLFYGCELAGGSAGRRFLRAFSEMTGAAVAASSNKTGHSAHGADWDLEFSSGEIKTDIFVSRQARTAWPGVLAPGINITESDDSTDVSETGSSDTFDVVLNEQPASDVVIDVASGDTGEATVSPSSLTFTSGNWDTAQTVNVSGVNDNLVDGTQTTAVTLSVDDANSDDDYDPLPDQTVTVSTADDEVAGFTVVEGADYAMVDETGDTDSFTVVLDDQPVSDVVIDVESTDTGEVAVSPTSLTFTNADWDTAQPVTVTGVDDTEIDGTQGTAVTLSIDVDNSDDEFDSVDDQDVFVFTADDESDLSPTNDMPSSQSVAEDDFLLFDDANSNKISITDNAGENLSVTISVADGVLTLSQTTGLSFSSGDGTADASMTLSGTVEDINAALDGLRYDPSANFNGSETLTISTSDETLLSHDLDPNLQGHYKFDSGDVLGDSSPNGAPDGTLLDNAGFGPGDGIRDGVLGLDGVDDGFEVASRFGEPQTFTLAAWVNVSSVDTNTADIINIGDIIAIRADTTTVNNWGDGVSATVRHAGDTFTIWNSGWYIRLTGWHHVAFTHDGGTGMGRLYLDGTEVVTATSSDPIDWAGFGATTRIGKHGDTATTADLGGYIDDARIYDRVLSGAELAELYTSPATATDTDTLAISVTPVNDPPTGTVTIDNTTPQVTDTLTASNTLADVDGLSGAIAYQWRRDGAAISGATGSTYTVISADAGAALSVVASYTDDDGTAESVSSADTAAVTEPGFTITESGGDTIVDESATTDTFTVVLDAPADSDVVIDVASGDTGEATVSPASLTFTSANWDTAQTVTVTGADDTVVDGDQDTSITLSINDAGSDDSFDSLADQTVTASTTDDEVASVTFAASGGDTSVDESGTTDTVSVVLDAQPVGDVEIYVLSIDSDEVLAVPSNPATLNFTSANWDTPQTVTLQGQGDDLIDGTQTATIRLIVNDANTDDNWDSVTAPDLIASNADTDVAEISVDDIDGSIDVSETGTTDTFLVRISAQPSSDVVLDIASGDAGEATVSPTSLTFDAGNWNDDQTVTITGIDDTVVDGTQNVPITVSVNDAASDDNFDPAADQTVTANNSDDEAAGFTVTESGGDTSVDESGASDTLDVVLDAEPVGDVVIDVTSGDTGEATVTPASLTFTSGNWNTAQTVTVTGADDTVVDGAQDTTVTLSIDDAGSHDLFDPLADQTVTVSTADDEVPNFSIDESDGDTAVDESGSTDTFTVVLTAQPVGDVVLTVGSTDPSEIDMVPAGLGNLTFTSADWDTPQTVTVQGIDDTQIDGTQNVTLPVLIDDDASDDNWDLVSSQTVSATNADDDVAGFAVTESGGDTTVDETGTTDTFTVVLDGEPNSDVVIDVSSGDTDEATVSPASMTFTSGNWNTAQTVTVTGADDTVVDGTQSTTITLSIDDAASDDLFDPVTDRTVTADTTDDEVAGFTVTETGGSTSVDESGTSDTFTVVLDGQPPSDVVIDVSSGDTGEATVAPASLTFTNANWDTAQTVTVTGADDDLIDGTQTTAVTLSVDDAGSDDNFDPLADQTVNADTTDDDSAGFTVTESGGDTSVDESGTTDGFTVVLDAEPGSDVVIDVSSGDVGEATVAPASLTFTNANWDTAQTVTVTGVDDDLIDGTQTTAVTLSVDDAGSDDNFDPLADQTVSADTTDDDSAGFTVTESGGDTSVDESGTTDTFTVVLDAEPGSDVVIDVSSGDTGEATVAPASLTFTNANWNSAQTVTVTGADDDLIDGTQTTAVTLSVDAAASDDDFDPLADQTVNADTTDDDAAGFTVTESGGDTSVDESGTTDTFTVVLDAEPDSDVVIDVTSGDTDEATVAPASLTFTNANWDTAQTVTVTGADDDLVDGTQTTAVTLSVDDAGSDDNFDPLADQAVNADTTDDDAAGFTVAESGGDTSVDESGTTDTFTVVLDAEPDSDVVIDVTSGDTGEATVAPASLTFTNANWDTAQTVTVTGADDALVDGVQTTAVTLSVDAAASDDNFDPLADQTVSVDTTDDDAAGFTVAESGGGTSVDESGTTDTFTVVLDAEPDSDVVIDVTSGDTGEATVSAASLTFTAANWNTAQTVTVTGADDTVVDGTQSTAITLSIDDAASDDTFDPLTDQTVTVDTGDDEAAGFTVTETGGSTAVDESGTTDTFTVVLDAQPASDVVIDVASGDTGEATVTPASLTFTNANWDTAQTVTVTGADDDLIDGTQTTAVTLSVDAAASNDLFDPLADQAVSADTTDDDTAGFTITESGGDTSVDESGATDSFTVALDAEPDSDVVIDVSSGDTGEVTVSSAALTFTSGNWNTAQTVTVTGADDDLVDGTQTTAVTLSVDDAGSDDNFDPLVDQTVSVDTVDDDTAGFTVAESGGDTSVNESGTTDTFTVVLDAEPDSDVVIDVTSGDTDEATVAPASLTFTNANWDTAQTVTVTGADDALVDGVQTTAVTLSVDDAGSDDNFDPLADQTVSVDTTDDDAAGFTVAESGGGTSVDESGTTDAFTVVLDAEPDSDVVIDVTSGDTDEATVAPASLTFTNANWDTAQTVTVTGADDDLIDGTQTTAVTLSVDAAASDDNFDPLADQTVNADTTDDDSAGFTVTESGGDTSVDESGTTDAFTVVLDAEPGSDVVIDVTSGDTGEATVAPASLTFTNANWDTAQTVTVTGADDDLIDGTQTTAVTLSVDAAASDDNFDPLADQAVNADTTDDDSAGFTVAESGGDTSVGESGTTDTFTVVLDAEPGSDVVIDVTSGDTDEATVTPASLTFTNVNWNTAQTVTVTGVDDDLVDGTQTTAVTLSVDAAASDDDFDALADQTVSADTTDDDSAGFTVAESGGGTSVDESGTTDTFTVELDAQPGSDVVIDVASGDSGEATAGPASLTFTNSNWNTAQTVTVTGIDDPIVDGPQSAGITLSINAAASDDDFDALADQTVTVTVADDETSLDDDNDGILNVTEGSGDTDGDGTPDRLDLDSDNDGIPDAIESDNVPPLSGNDSDADGIDDAVDVDNTGGTDANFNGVDDAFEPVDSDGDGLADYVDPDSDDDGLPDGLEADNLPTPDGNDADSDGIDDALDADLTGGTDADGNGLDDAFEPRDTDNDGIADYRDTDSDNDGILDGVEADVAGADADFDGIDNAYDVDQTAGPDADGDGVDDSGATDTDNDGRPDYRDLDSDNDGLPDVTEAGLTDADGDGFSDGGAVTATPADSDGDTTADYRDLDSNNDAVFDIVDAGQASADSDGDGQVDVFVDPDNDGVANVIDPAPTIFGLLAGSGDGDGIPNNLDADDDGDGIPDAVEAPGGTDVDSDGDGVVDRLDLDSDNDGIPDSMEAFAPSDADLDGDGMVDDTADADNNGLADSIPVSMIPADTDGDGTPDHLDTDSDGDGITDLWENYPADADALDADGDGVLDASGDSDGDGLSDAIDPDIAGNARFALTDTDADRIPDFRDLDSDNDGFSDAIENGDFNGSGTPDHAESGDGIKTSIPGGGGSSGGLVIGLLLLLLRCRKRNS